MRYATSCSACRSRNATTSWSARPRRDGAARLQAGRQGFPGIPASQTHEEYALARTERKSGRGYKGFTVYASPEVTLEEDLKRRDLTINAMAKAEDGTLIDPFGGKKDLESGVLRHVSEAFAENPVRILRVARFAAASVSEWPKKPWRS